MQHKFQKKISKNAKKIPGTISKNVAKIYIWKKN